MPVQWHTLCYTLPLLNLKHRTMHPSQSPNQQLNSMHIQLWLTLEISDTTSLKEALGCMPCFQSMSLAAWSVLEEEAALWLMTRKKALTGDNYILQVKDQGSARLLKNKACKQSFPEPSIVTDIFLIWNYIVKWSAQQIYGIISWSITPFKRWNSNMHIHTSPLIWFTAIYNAGLDSILRSQSCCGIIQHTYILVASSFAVYWHWLFVWNLIYSGVLCFIFLLYLLKLIKANTGMIIYLQPISLLTIMK